MAAATLSGWRSMPKASSRASERSLTPVSASAPVTPAQMAAADEPSPRAWGMWAV